MYFIFRQTCWHFILVHILLRYEGVWQSWKYYPYYGISHDLHRHIISLRSDNHMLPWELHGCIQSSENHRLFLRKTCYHVTDMCCHSKKPLQSVYLFLLCILMTQISIALYQIIRFLVLEEWNMQARNYAKTCIHYMISLRLLEQQGNISVVYMGIFQRIKWPLSSHLPEYRIYASLLRHLPEYCIYAPVNPVSIGSDNGLSSIWRQAFIKTNTGLLSIGPLGAHFSEILLNIQNCDLRKCIWKYRLRNGCHCVQWEMS